MIFQRIVFNQSSQKRNLPKISALGDYISQHISQKINIAGLSSHFGLSPKKLQAGVHYLYGYSVNNYITNVRLEMAKELIYTTDKNVSDICYEVGYSSRSYFSKLFNERFGKLPSALKNSFKNEELLFEVTYRSMARAEVTEKDLENILETSREMNKKYGVTGSLIYHRRVFFQLIEGPKKNILKLYNNIKKDKRHFDVITMWQGVKLYRDFEEWDMALLSDDGALDIPYEGDTKSLSLRRFMGDLDEQSVTSQNLWRMVRNVLKTANA